MLQEQIQDMNVVGGAYPIEHWSYSSMSMFLRNRMAFKKRYILKVYDQQMSPSALVGQACHVAAAELLKGASVDVAVSAGMRHMDKVLDTEVDWGKTGSREKARKNFNQGFQHFIQEHPKHHKIIDVEKSLTEHFSADGIQLALPAKAILDLIIENEAGELELEDHKFVGSHTDQSAENPKYFLQSMFGFVVTSIHYGRAPKRMRFQEYKISANKDGTSQRQEYVIEFDQHPHYFQAFYNLYNECTAEIANSNCRYLPNFDDMYEGEQNFMDYLQGLIGFDSPVLVQHKTAPVVVKDHRFVESEATKTENKYLTDEEKIRAKLLEFGLPVQMDATHKGASVTLYTFKPGRACKMSSFENLDKDVALALEAKSIRIQAPIMGTSLVGVEVPSKEQRAVKLFDEGNDLSVTLPADGKLNLAIGQDVYGQTVIKALDDMPHLLVAGATGSGKSVMLNSIIQTLSRTHTSAELRMVLIDPKRVEFTQFRDLPHLLTKKIITDDKVAVKTLKWLVEEMEYRYETLEQSGARNILEYNESVTSKMTKLVVVIDEFADLVLQARHDKKPKTSKKVVTKRRGVTITENESTPAATSAEEFIVRLAQKSRAVGIHLILGTQRPSVDVVTGILKANLPCRIAFMTASETDSRVILDESGAEQLIGRGDMLFLNPQSNGLQRLQGFYC